MILHDCLTQGYNEVRNGRQTLSGRTLEPRSFKLNLNFLFSSLPVIVILTVTEVSADEVVLWLAIVVGGVTGGGRRRVRVLELSRRAVKINKLRACQ